MSGNPIDSEAKAARARAAIADDSGKHGEGFMRQVADDLRAWEADHPPATDPNPDELDAAGNPIAATPPTNVHETTLEPIKIKGDPNAGEESLAARMAKAGNAAYSDLHAREAKPEAEVQGPTSHYVSPWEALARGGGQGATLRYGDEISSRLVPEATDTTGIPREYAEGSAQAAMQAQMRRDNAEAQASQPKMYGVGEMAGVTPLAIATGGLAPEGEALGLGARTAFNAAQGGAISGTMAKGSGASNKEALKDALLGAGTAGGLTMTAAGLAPAAEAAAAGGEAAAAKFNNRADVNRLRAAGATKGQIDRMRDPGGAELPFGRYASAAEELRTKQPLLKRLIPRNADFYNERAGEAVRTAEAQKSALEAALADAPVDTDVLANRIEQEQQAYPPGEGAAKREAIAEKAKLWRSFGGPGEVGNPLAPGVNDFADLPPAVPNLRSPPPIKTRQATFVTKEGATATGDVPEIAAPNTQASASKTMRPGRGRAQASAPEMASSVDTLREFPAPVEDVPPNRNAMLPPAYRSMPFSRGVAELQELADQGKWDALNPAPSQQVRGRAYGAINEGLENAANEAQPGAGTNWRALKEQQHRMMRIRDAASGQELRDLTGGPLRSNEMMTAGFGVLAGHPIGGAALAAGEHVVRSRGRDALASFLRARAGANEAGAGAARAFARGPGADLRRLALGPASSPAAAGAAAAATPAPFRGITPRPAPAGAALAQQDRAPDDTTGTRGQMLPDAAWSLYKQDPQAFGPYAENLLQARQRGEGQFAAELSRLESDPEFSRTVLPRLRQMTRRE
jgi:hypothetical protein